MFPISIWGAKPTKPPVATGLCGVHTKFYIWKIWYVFVTFFRRV